MRYVRPLDSTVSSLHAYALGNIATARSTTAGAALLLLDLAADLLEPFEAVLSDLIRLFTLEQIDDTLLECNPTDRRSLGQVVLEVTHKDVGMFA